MFAAAEVAKLTQEEYAEYVASLNAYRDLKNSMDTAREEGEAIGRAEEKINTAIRLLKKGMSIENVSDATELSQEQIEQLIKETKKE